ncbi:MAG: response regulator [Chromatiales bacterium]|nr:response regulator [Chromatiales bacterium]
MPRPHPASQASDPEYLVAIGCSSGGLLALRSILGDLECCGLSAYVLAQHLSPDEETRLPEILAPHTTLTVAIAATGDRLRPDHLHICPAGWDLEVRDGRLFLSAPEPNALIAPSIDRLFRSVAKRFGERAIGLILSGTGQDGREGGALLLAAGGQLIVQSPAEASEPAMPNAALAACDAALCGDSQEIVRWLNRIETLRDQPRACGPTDRIFTALIARVAQATGLSLECYKEGTLRRQTARHYQSLGFDSLETYFEHVKDDPEQLRLLQRRFLISVSRFFRDPDVFGALEQALRHQLGQKIAGDAIRLWIPACATGEEVYSVLILLHEILGERLADFEVRVFATDLDPDALDTARAGLYPPEALSRLDVVRRERWFHQQGSLWRVDKALRELCVFCIHDLLAHPPFLNMDLISCRNLLIYVRPEQQAELFALFHYALRPSGLLLLGQSESIGASSHSFEPVDTLHKLYRRRDTSVSRPPRLARHPSPMPLRHRLPTRNRSRAEPNPLRDAALDELMRAYDISAVLVDTDFEPVQFFGNAKRYFTLPDDTGDFSIFSLCLPELRIELKALGYRLLQESVDVLPGIGMRLRIAGRSIRIRPVARRIRLSSDDPLQAFLIVFEERLSDDRSAEAQAASADDDSEEDEITHLRHELAETREYLQSVLDQQEITHEELQSLHEEIQVSTEELQTANEELQSSNEELTTLNDELRLKTHEATHLSTTLTNIQNSIRTALVVVDRDGRLTRFNALAVRIFGIVEDDIGNHLAGIPCHLSLPNLRECLECVVTQGESVIERVHQGDFHYLMQIDPYRNEFGQVVGAILNFSDISELHRAESAHAGSEQRLRLALDAARAGTWEWDVDNDRSHWSERNWELYGLKPGTVEPSYGSWRESVHPEDLEGVARIIREAVEQGTGFEAEWRVNLPPCEPTRWLLSRGQPIPAQSGRPRRYIGTVIDITAQKEAVQRAMRLSEKEAELKEAQRLAHLGNWYWDPATDRLRGSEELLRIFGLEPTAEHLEGFSEAASRLFPASVWRRLKAASLETWRTGVGYNLDLEARRGDETIWVTTHSEAVRDAGGRLLGLRGTVQDITERKRLVDELERHRHGLELRVEERTRELARQERLWAEVMRLLPVGVWITDPSGAIVFANAAGQRIWAGAHYVDPERFDLYQGWWHATGEALAPEDWALARAIRTGESSLDEVLDIQCFDGSRKTILNWAIALRDESDQLMGAFCVNQDITPLKQAERALSEARDRAEASNQAKSAFLANMSHEIRTPMNAVLGFCYLLEQRTLDPTSADLVHKIHRAGQALLGLINDILDFSKIEAGHLEIEATPFRLSEMLDTLAGIMTAAAGDKPLELILTPPGERIEGLIGDAGRLQQVLINLLGNAVKFTACGEVELRLERVAEHEDRLALRFMVRDTGIGIAPEHQTEIFNAFAQADTSIGRRFGGTGLGLAISQRLVRMMGGQLELESAPEQGSAFYFTLPLRRDPNAPEPAAELGRLRLLVVDDCATAGAALVQTARALGWWVDWADSSAAAQEHLAARLALPSPYDAVLIDWRMPGEDGLSCARALQATVAGKGLAKPPALLLMTSPQSRPDLEAQPGIATIDAILDKPVTPSALYNALASLRGARRRYANTSRLLSFGRKSRQLAGLRVLVVDDSEINQEVASGILAGQGAQVSVAGDGEAALAWLDAYPDAVDIVLMDVQMPRLDGYAATRRLRQDPRRHNLPVIALTAGAFQSMQEAARAAGMNDFVAKPFNVARLIACIQRWTGTAPAEDSVTNAAPPSATEVDPPSAFESVTAPDADALADHGIDLPTALERWGDPQLYRTYLLKFRDGHAADAQTIAAAIRSEAFAEGHALAHKLTGVAATLALPRVATLARTLEQILHEDRTPDASLVTELQAALTDVLAGLQDWADAASSPRSAPAARIALNHDALGRHVDELLRAVIAQDLNGAESCLKQLHTALDDERLGAIKRCLDDFDFRVAESLARTLTQDLGFAPPE